MGVGGNAMGFGPIMTHMRMQPWPDRLCMCLTQLYACLRRLLHQLWARVPSLLTVSIECLARLGIRSNAWRARYHNCQHASIDDEQYTRLQIQRSGLQDVER